MGRNHPVFPCFGGGFSQPNAVETVYHSLCPIHPILWDYDFLGHSGLKDQMTSDDGSAKQKKNGVHVLNILTLYWNAMGGSDAFMLVRMPGRLSSAISGNLMD